MDNARETFEAHKQRLRDAEEDVMDALIALGKTHKLTALEWAGVLTQCLFSELASALADTWEGRTPR
jgi:hypothetical protein